MSYTYTTHHCMECDSVISRLSIVKCKKCGMELCKKCSGKNKGICVWCMDEAPDEYLWKGKFATILMILSPVFGFLLPLPLPIIMLAIQSNLKLLVWGGVYTALFLIIFGVMKSKSKKAIMDPSLSRTPSLVPSSPASSFGTSAVEDEEDALDFALKEDEIGNVNKSGITCTACGSSLSPDDDFCPECGTGAPKTATVTTSTFQPAVSSAPKTSRLYTETKPETPLPASSSLTFRPGNAPVSPLVTPLENRCQSCGEIFGEDDAFCANCGTAPGDDSGAPPQDDSKCSGCGRELTPGDVFCGFCGKPV